MNNITSAFKGSAGLTQDYYEALVTSAMEPYRLAVARAKARKDELSVESAIYTDMGTKLNSLHSAVEALRSGDSSIFDDKTATTGDSTILSATATSSADDAVYDINVTQMAAAHRIRGDQQVSQTTGLGYAAGSFIINGVSISIDDDASLNDIRDAINDTVATAIEDETITEEAGFTATIIDKQLVLTANSTGEDFELTITDTDGKLNEIGMFNHAALQEAQNAQFTINNIPVIRNSNTGLDDVIEGVTLNLAGEGETTLTVAPNESGAQTAISTFISRLNDLTTWLNSKTGVRENSDGTYTRGALADDNSIKGLRRQLVQKTFGTWADAPEGSTYTRLDQLGIELGDNLSASLADSSKLSTALSTNYSEVVSLFEGIMEKVQDLIDPYTEGTDTRI
ncbi:MAG: flagellar filament capping protein FliD, partial [Caldilineaceae bacterium]|nr:flagellar filament capping protein FliD [Caldilineaceae bacterium]